MHIKSSPRPPQPCPSLRHKKLLMLVIAKLFAAALYQAKSGWAWRASESQKVAAKSPWEEEKRVKGRKVEELTPVERPEGVPPFWGH